MDTIEEGGGRLWGVLRQKLEILRSEGRLEEAIELFKRLKDVAERGFPPGSLRHIETLALGARVMQAAGRPGEARAVFLEAVEAASRQEPPDHSTLSALCDWVRALSEELGDAETSLRFFRKAAEHARAAAELDASPARQREAALLSNNLGLAEKRSGNTKEAAALYHAAIALLENLAGEEALLADALNNLGVLVYESGALDEAWKNHSRALAIREASPSATLADIAQSHTNLAVICHTRGETDRAAAHYQKALEILDSAPGLERAALESLVFSYTALLRATGRDREADALEDRLRRLH